MIKNIIRTRYAPSPTGYFHIGGARTALFNFLFARSNNGIFIIRIEDTDIERNIGGGIESQLNNLKWLKLFFDESIENPGIYGPYIQSKRLDVYLEYAEKLLKKGEAYKCFCSKEELEEEKNKAILKKIAFKYSRKCLNLNNEEIKRNEINNIPYVIRLKIIDEAIFEWDDLIRGKIKFEGYALTDPVIIKSNKIATYNFAASIDDNHMKISHVLRGEEHISNTPYQIAISKALGINQEIKYGHLSLIIDENKQKLSKRNSDVKQFIDDYHKMGFPPEAIVNYISLLGWSPKNNIEIKSLQDIIKEFSLENVSSSPSMFDFKKFEWVSREYFKLMDDVTYLDFVIPFLKDELKNNKDINNLSLVFKDQISHAIQLNDYIDDLLNMNDITFEFLTNNNIIISNEFEKLVNDLYNEFSFVEDWTHDAVEEIFKTIKSNNNLKGKDLYLPIRLATTTKISGPQLSKIIFLLGKERVVKNISETRSFIKFYKKAVDNGI
ncbi:MAG: glutamate--tRNA ligase [Mycoplasmoidaceae bacterium]